MERSLGKRKGHQDDSGQEEHGSTLFISNLPYTATSTDLQTLFSDIAPVRTAFVVTEQGTGVSKGVGYVSFALKEDAESCFTKISEEGLSLAGRAIRAQWADKRTNSRDPKVEKEKKQVKSRPQKSFVKTAHDPLAIRTIIVSGLPSGIDSNTLWKKIRKSAGAEKLVYPIKNESGEEDPSTAHVTFVNPKSAEEAVHKLHAHVYKGSLLSVTLKKRLENLAKPVIKKASKPTETPATTVALSRSSRLIVRNLPFSATEQDLRALFLPHGPVYSIDMPRTQIQQGENKETRNKGFAFVWMLAKKDAEKALEACNGKTVRAGMAQELVSEKQKKKKERRLEKKMKAMAVARTAKTASAAEGEDGEEERDEESEEEEGEKATKQDVSERIIAVDWALSKSKWKEEVEKAEQAKDEEQDTDVDMASGSGSEEGSDEEDSDASSASDDGLGVHGGDGDSDNESWDSDEEGSRDGDDVPVKPTLPAPEAGTTLFVRNVPYEATDDELRTLFRAFGPLRYARITMDHETGRSRGTGFACFWNKEDADKVIEQSNILRSETTGQTLGVAKKNPFSLPSILTPDPSSSLARTLVLHGRTLDVVRAVTRDVASKLREEGEKLREKQDKRNTYLVREGVIFPNSPEASQLPPSELERRNASYDSRKRLLKANPSLFISRTRLSVRQLPIFATERMLKRLAIHGVRAFETEVKDGSRKPLTEDEMTERSDDRLTQIIQAGIDEQEGKKSGKPRPGKEKGRHTSVKQSKVVRVSERVDPLTGKGRSKGYGFIEMHTHADALRVLRWANNNPKVNPLFEEWWKDELKDILKREKAQPKPDDDRVKLLKDEIEGNSGKKREGRGRLIVEFSIENIQVVQRRSGDKKEKTTSESASKKDKSDKDKKRNRKVKEADDEQDDEAMTPPKKKLRTSDGSGKPSTVKGSPSKAEKPKKDFNPVGSVIGRKRKARKMKKP